MQRLPPVTLLLLAACAGGGAPVLPQPAGPAAMAPTTRVASDRREAASGAAGSATADVAPEDPAPSALTPVAPGAAAATAMLEPLYSAQGHRKLATDMLTLARDEELFQWALGGSSRPEHVSRRTGFHPATRVVVDVSLLSRAPKGSTRKLLRVARSAGYWPFRSCFEDAQRAVAKPSRQARLRLTLGAQGRVLGSRSLGATSERSYANCVLTKARALDFRPGFGRKLDIELTVKQWPGDAPVPPRAPDDETPLAANAESQVELAALRSRFSECYRAALAQDEGLWGRVALRLTLAPDGSVQDSQPVETTFPDPEVTRCARRAVAGVRLSGVTGQELTLAVRLGQLPPTPPAPETAGAPLSLVGAPPEPAPPAPPAAH